MRRKILISLVSLCLAVITVGTLFACDCGKYGKKTDDTNTHTHVFTNMRTTPKYLASEATCVTLAKYYYSCVFCEQAGTETYSTGKFKDHNFTAEVIEDKYLASPATCTQKAKYYYACSVCGKAGTTTFEYGDFSAEHTFATSWTYDANYHWHAATCGHDVTKDKEAHTFANNTCNICGYSKDRADLNLTELDGFALAGRTLTKTVEYNTTNYTFAFGVKSGATVTVYSDSAHTTAVTSGTISNVGATNFYLRVQDDNYSSNYTDYTITINRKSNLVLDSTTFNVSGDTATYTVENNIETYNFASKFTVAGGTYVVYTDSDCTTQVTTTQNLIVGANTFYLKATDSVVADNTKVYTVTINRKSNLALSSEKFTVSGGSATLTVENDTTTYDFTNKFTVADGTYRVYSDSNCTLDVTASATLSSVGANTFYLKATDNVVEDNIKVYTVVITRESARGFEKDGFTLVGSKLTKIVENGVSSYIFNFVANEGSTAKVYSDSSCVNQVTTQSLNVGDNTFYLRVQDTSTSEYDDYTVTIIRKASLELGSNDLEIDDKGMTAVNIVENSVTTYDFTGKFTYDTTNVTVKIYQDEDHETEITTSVGLEVGDENVFYLVVQDNKVADNKAEYTITITRKADLTLTENDGFSLVGNVLTKTVDYYTSTYTFVFEVGPGATVTVYKSNSYTLENVVTNLDLEVSSNTCYLVVQDNTVSDNKAEYTITITRSEKINLDISSSEFEVGLALATKTVENDVETYDFTDKFTVAAGATYSIYYEDNYAEDSKITGEVELVAGKNKYYLRVTDGTKYKNYTITITRKADISLKYLDEFIEDTLNKTLTKTVGYSKDSYTFDFASGSGSTVTVHKDSGYKTQITSSSLKVGANIFYLMVQDNEFSDRVDKYTITIIRKEASALDLTNTDGFTEDPSNKTLKKTVDNSIDIYTFNFGVDTAKGASYKVYTDLNYTNEVTNPVSLSVGGDNVWYLRITDNLENNDYTITITRRADLTLTSSDNNITIDADNKTVTKIVDNGTIEYTFVFKVGTGATVTVYTESSHKNAITKATGLSVGKKTYYLVVKDTATEETVDYTVTVIRKADLTLTSTDGFDINSTDKTAKKTVENSVATYDFTGKFTVSTGVTVAVYKESGHTTVATSVDLSVGENLYYLVVKDNTTGDTVDYTVTIIRKADLTLTSTDGFDINSTDKTAKKTVENSVATYDFTGKFTVGTGVTVAVYKESGHTTVATSVDLSVGKNLYYLVVKDNTTGDTVDYTVTIIREADLNLLSSDKAFTINHEGKTAKKTVDYSANATYDFTGVFSSFGSTVKVTSGIDDITNSTVNLDVGNNTFNATITDSAVSDKTNTYTIMITVRADLTLTSTDEFDINSIDKKTAKKTVDNSVDTYDFTGKFTVSTGATVTVYKESGHTDVATSVDLSVGENLYYLVVKDNVTEETVDYTVTIIRKASLKLESNDLEIDDKGMTAINIVENSVTTYDFTGKFTYDTTNVTVKIYQDADHETEITTSVALEVGNENVFYLVVQDNKVADHKAEYTITITRREQFITELSIMFDLATDDTTANSGYLENKLTYTGTVTLTNPTRSGYTGVWEDDNNNTITEVTGFEGGLTASWTPDVTLSADGTTVTGLNNNSADLALVIRNKYDGFEVNVTAIAENAFKDKTTIKSVTIAETITSIGEGAFRGCSSLTGDLKIPDGVTVIEASVFDGCSSLTGELKIPVGVTSIGANAFNGCSSLTGTLTIPAGVTSIGVNAFKGCSSLTGELIIPSAVTTIGNYAFANCLGFTSVVLNGTLNKFNSDNYDGYRFAGCTGLTTVNLCNNRILYGYEFDGCTSLVEIKTTKTNIFLYSYAFKDCIALTTVPSLYGANYASFYNCSSLTSVTFVEGNTSINTYTFYGCSSLTSVTIPEKYQSINYGAFYNCSSLVNIDLPDQLTTIGAYAFYNCSSLASITLPAKLISIGGVVDNSSNAFHGCLQLAEVINLSSLKIVKGETSYGYVAYYAKSVKTSGTSDIEIVDNYVFYTAEDNSVYLVGYNGTDKALTLPADYNSKNYAINDRAFYNRSDLTSIKMSAGVTGIGEYAFYGCTGLTSVTMGDNVTSIGNYAFYNCNSLTSVNVPNIVGNMGTNVFENCSSLQTVSIANGVTAISSNAFNSCSALTSVSIPSTVTSIGGYAFYNCKNLQVTEANSKSKGSFDVSNVTSLGASAFSGCSSITGITLPTGLKSLESAVFLGCEDLKKIDMSNTPSITKIGTNAFSSCKGLTSLTIGSGVKTIDVAAFYECTGLTTLVIPDNVTTVKKQTFWGCKGLTSVTLGSGLTSIAETMFYGCTGLTTITLPDSITSIWDSAFYDCTGLTSIVIPDNVTSIGDSAFYNCTKICKVTLGSSLETIGANAFYNCNSNGYENSNSKLNYENKFSLLTVPASVKSIGDKAFYGCYNLREVINLSNLEIAVSNVTHGYVAYYAIKVSTSEINSSFAQANDYDWYNDGKYTYLVGYHGQGKDITLPSKDDNGNSYYYIGSSAFYNRRDLTSITIPEGIVIIYANAFYGCTSLTSITIPSSVTTIYASAFEGCSSLTTITFGENSKLKSIWRYTFKDCSSLTNIEIPSGVTQIGYYLFDGCTDLANVKLSDSTTIIQNYAFRNCSSLTSIKIPSTVTSIGAYAFYACSSLTSIEIPSGVTNIYEYTFVNCTSLKTVTIPSTVKTIYYHSFYGCSGLESITIPAAVTAINSFTFYGCTGLKTVKVLGNIKTISNYAFYMCSNLESITLPSTLTSIGTESFFGCYKLAEIINLSSLTIDLGSDENGYVGYYAVEVKTSETSTVETDSNGFLWYTKTDGSVYLVGYKGAETAITLPDSYNGKTYEIKSYAFMERSDLTSVTLSSGVTSIGTYAFYGCSGLTSIAIPDSVKTIGSGAFNLCRGLTSLDLGNGVTTIGSSAFYGCINLTTVTIPNSVTSLGAYVFNQCSGLVSVVISDNVTTIGTRAFYACTSLTNVVIGKSVKTIENYAFYSCSNLTTVYYAGSSVEWKAVQISTNYGGLSSATIYYYSETKPTTAGNYWHYVDNVVTVW